MSLILILSSRLKQMTYSYVLHRFEIQRIAHISLEPDVGLQWGMDQNVGFDIDMHR